MKTSINSSIFTGLTSLLLVTFVIGISPSNSFAQSKIQQWDDRIMIDLAEHRTPTQTGFLMFLSRNYRYGDIGVPAGMFIGGVLGHDQQLRQNSLYVASSTFLSYGVTMLIKRIVKRPRPFIKNLQIIPVYRAGSYSFPSGHTSSTIATATAVSLAYPKWYVIAPSFLWAGATSYSRMYLGVHYPTDVAAGAAIGAGTAVSLGFLRK